VRDITFKYYYYELYALANQNPMLKRHCVARLGESYQLNCVAIFTLLKVPAL